MLEAIPLTIQLLEGIADRIHSTNITLLDDRCLFFGKTIDGYGEIDFRNGNFYKGNLDQGVIDGQGEFIWADGVKYTG
jgi:hypothetical protein